MSPPECDNVALPQSPVSRDDLQRIKWAGWTLAGVLLCAWAGWLSLLAIRNATGLARTDERQNNQYMHLREDIKNVRGDLAELKELIPK